jgi:hypothetical protein
VACAGGAGLELPAAWIGRHSFGGSRREGVTGEREVGVTGALARGPGAGVESGYKSPKKHLLRDFSIFSPQ